MAAKRPPPRKARGMKFNGMEDVRAQSLAYARETFQNWLATRTKDADFSVPGPFEGLRQSNAEPEELPDAGAPDTEQLERLAAEAAEFEQLDAQRLEEIEQARSNPVSLTDVQWLQMRNELEANETRAHRLLQNVRKALEELVDFAENTALFSEVECARYDRSFTSFAVGQAHMFALDFAGPALGSEPLTLEQPGRSSRPEIVDAATHVFRPFGEMPRHILACFSVLRGSWPESAVQSALDRSKGQGITVAVVLDLESTALDNVVRALRRARTP